MEPDSEAIFRDNSLRLPERAINRMITRILKLVIASGLPINEGTAEEFNHPIITAC
jgi:hypothetical protein